MMSQFSMSPFGRSDMGPAGLGKPRLGDLSALYSEVLQKIADLMQRIPSDIAGQYQTRLDACKAMADGSVAGDIAAGGCLYALYNDMQKPQQAPVPGYVPPAPSTFPWLTVGIVGVTGIALVALLMKKK